MFYKFLCNKAFKNFIMSLNLCTFALGKKRLGIY